MRGAVLAAAVGGLVAACTSFPHTETEPVTGGDAEVGRLLLVEYGCTSCHRVPGTDVPQGRVGPPLGDFVERRAVAGELPHTPENAVLWITDPDGVDPTTLMPDLGVTEAEAEAILAYLYSLD